MIQWHRTPGTLAVVEHWQRICRWNDRFKTFCVDGKALDSIDALDHAVVLLITCFSLRDWLLKAWPGEESEVYDLFNSSWELQVCRDIANGAKHLDLSRPPSVDAHYQIALSRSYWTETGAPRNEFVLQAGGKRAELSEFCRACVEQLRQWLVTRGLTSEDGHKFAGFGPRLASSEGSG